MQQCPAEADQTIAVLRVCRSRAAGFANSCNVALTQAELQLQCNCWTRCDVGQFWACAGIFWMSSLPSERRGHPSAEGKSNCTLPSSHASFWFTPDWSCCWKLAQTLRLTAGQCGRTGQSNGTVLLFLCFAAVTHHLKVPSEVGFVAPCGLKRRWQGTRAICR